MTSSSAFPVLLFAGIRLSSADKTAGVLSSARTAEVVPNVADMVQRAHGLGFWHEDRRIYSGKHKAFFGESAQ